ncbi:hypothetical protein VCHENC02_0154A, partial [Vibrio harveyi]|jgi:hypothetical protein
MHHL